MATPSSKRRRVEISASIKKKICQHKEDHPKATIQDICQHIIAYSSLDIGKSTIADIIKNKDKWLSVAADSADLTHARHAKYQQVDDAVFMWFSDMLAHLATVNDEMLIAKAKILGDQLSITDFAYSCGWLQRFKNRRGIKRKLYEGEADSADMNKVQAVQVHIIIK